MIFVNCNKLFINIIVEHGIENLITCVYSLMDFYLIKKKYPQTHQIPNFGKPGGFGDWLVAVNFF